MSYDPIIATRAGQALADLPAHIRDQVDALVSQICRDPWAGEEDEAEPDFLHRNRVMRLPGIVAAYQVLENEKIVRVVRVVWRG